MGLWLWNSGAWTQLSGVNPDYIFIVALDYDYVDEIVGDFGSQGIYQLDYGDWTKISGANPE